MFGVGLLQTDHSAPAWHWPVPAFVRRWRQTKGQYDIDTSRWMTEKAPTPVELWAQDAIDTTAKWGAWNGADSNHIVAGTVTSEHLRSNGIAWTGANKALKIALAGVQEAHNLKQEDFVLDSDWHSNRFASNHNGPEVTTIDASSNDRELFHEAIRRYGSRPVIPPPRRELEVLRLVDVDEVFWDIASMIDAHRNHATALERPLAPMQGLVGATPIFAEVATYLFDPRHEMGPRQRSWHRQNRTQPVNTPRKKRKGRK